MFTKLFQTLGAMVPSSHLVFQRPISVTSKPHIMKIRKHKMRKSKWRKRINKEWFQYKKKHVVKKQKSEGFFRARMHEMLTELEQFNAMGYVKETMAKANKEWHLDAAPSGRKRHPHWSTLMSLEELFGVENIDYIDKRCGLPSLEDRPALDKLREEYRRAYIVPDPVELLEKFNNAARISEGTRERTAEEIGGGLSSSDAKKKK